MATDFLLDDDGYLVGVFLEEITSNKFAVVLWLSSAVYALLIYPA